MDRAQIARFASPRSVGKYVVKLAASRPTMHHGAVSGSVREKVHNGHHIVITTTYIVSVDGRDVDLPLHVDDRGNLHCHSLPNYSFESALDAVATLVDNFPDEFAGPRRKGARRKKPAVNRHSHPGSKKKKKRGG